MKQILSSILLAFVMAGMVRSQPVNGMIYADTAGVQVVKVWGTHQERGYALGYLTGDRITDVIVNYVKPSFGPYYSLARNTVLQGNDLSIPPEYESEAQAVVDGMIAAGTNTGNLDKTDILVGNTFLDISHLLMLNLGINCSALMSWNDATAGTDLNGTSVVTRHLDWEYSPVLNRNHTIVVHFPTEPGLSKWATVGFSGMLGILSGFNPDYSAFQNMMDDYTVAGIHNKHYVPIWFALRKAIEATDYNSDGNRNVMDVRSALEDCPDGFSDGFIISALAKSDPVDSLVALVAEITSTAPMHTYRHSGYPDSIPGDNLYTANYQIARNNLMHFCPRYNGIRTHIGDGTMIGRDTSWNLMKNWSHLSTNTQFMQLAPEVDLFRISVYRNGQPAYLNEPVAFSLSALFNQPVTGIEMKGGGDQAWCRYHPASGLIEVRSQEPIQHVELVDLSGHKTELQKIDESHYRFRKTPVDQGGVYIIRVTTLTGTMIQKVIVPSTGPSLH